MRTRSAFGLVVGGAVVGALGCGAGAPRAKSVEKAGASAKAPACARVNPGVGATRLGAVRASAPVVLARAPDGTTLAYVADADEPTLHTIDIDHGKEIAATDLHGKPEHAMVLADGRVAVTLRFENAVEVLEPSASPSEPLASRCTVDVPTEPIAMAATPSDDAVLVTSAWAHAVTALDGATLDRKWTADVAREPRAIVVDDEGKRAFVAHVVGAKMSVVPLDGAHEKRELSLAAKKIGPSSGGSQAKTRSGCQGFALAKAIPVDEPEGGQPPVAIEETPKVVPAPPAPQKPAPKPSPKPPKAPAVPGRIFAPMVTVDPGDPGRIAYYGNSDGLATEVAEVPVVDELAERVMTRSVLAPARSFRSSPSGTAAADECLLPRSVAFAGSTVLVACLGVDALVQYDARALDPARVELRRWHVASGPTGVAFDGAHRRAVVWSQFDRAVSIVDLDEEKASPAVLAVSRKAGFGFAGDAAVGRVLYHRTGDARISVEGMACASCHPEGREDAITWGTSDGPRQTIMLAGRLEQGPYSWSGAHATVEEHLKDTMSRLRGNGLSEADLHALATYVRALPPPKLGAADVAGERAKLVAEGEKVFRSAESGCATCHMPDKDFADGMKHDVELGVSPAPGVRALETPSLRFVSGTAPYFHDGRYATLEDMLGATDHGMGTSAELTREQRAALAAYLETL